MNAPISSSKTETAAPAADHDTSAKLGQVLQPTKPDPYPKRHRSYPWGVTAPPWAQSDPGQWDFEHGPRSDEWLERTGSYTNRGSCETPSVRLWYRAVPALAWSGSVNRDSWMTPYLEDIRLVVVDQLGVRRPCPGDPLEETICGELVELIELIAAPIHEEAKAIKEFEDKLEQSSPSEMQLYRSAAEAHLDHIYRFYELLRMRDLGDGRIAIAFGQCTSFPEDYDALRREGYVRPAPQDS